MPLRDDLHDMAFRVAPGAPHALYPSDWGAEDVKADHLLHLKIETQTLDWKILPNAEYVIRLFSS